MNAAIVIHFNRSQERSAWEAKKLLEDVRKLQRELERFVVRAAEELDIEEEEPEEAEMLW